jgi:hypothetical protein
MIELILKDIQDLYVRENFFRLRNFLGDQVLFEGDFRLYDITIPKAEKRFRIKHGMSFIPADIINLAFQGNGNYYFHYQEFDRENMYVTALGPVRIRFLAGKLKDPVRAPDGEPFPFVAPGDVLAPSSPGFVYVAINAQSANYWLTGGDGISSNITGIPVLFGDAVVTLAAIGADAETDITIGIYQHDGNGLNMAEVGQFSAVVSGPKRFTLNYPIAPSTNTQLACRILSGNSTNLKVSLVVKGTAI